ncbi:MAG: ABC transporter permease [Acidobacteria bacterium]|jgi:putative ABC transport system permease protein|nr:ABC transporter permease [Acidobacteriota bacterium]
MGFGELGREAVAALRAHNLRSFLTLLGIIIGVGTLVGVVSVITGLNAYVRERVIQLSPDVYVVQKFGIIQGRDEFMDALKRRDIDWNDYEKLRGTLERAETVAADATSTSVVKRRHRRLADVNVHGTTANYGALMRLDIEAGRFFTPGEDEAGRAVAVIGWDIRDELFGPLDPIGREILIGAESYRVIGLVAQQGRTLGQSQDNQVWIPAQTYRRTFGGRRSIDVVIQARGGVAGLESSVDEVRAVLRALRHTSFNAPDPFGIVTVDRLQELWGQISGATIILSLLIASVSLGVGGIVIMNIMLVAVVERTREIGVRLSLGARKRDIRRQFLLEAALLALGGGIAGVLLGAGAAFGVEGVLNFPARVTPAIVLAGLALSIGVGLAAGYWPARSASNLPVVEALRTE